MEGPDCPTVGCTAARECEHLLVEGRPEQVARAFLAELVRSGKLSVTPPMAEGLLRVIDALASMLDQLRSTRHIEHAIGLEIDVMDRIIEGDGPAPVVPAPMAAPQPVVTPAAPTPVAAPVVAPVPAAPPVPVTAPPAPVPAAPPVPVTAPPAPPAALPPASAPAKPTKKPQARSVAASPTQ